MASLAELLLGKDNPVTQWTGRNANLLTGLGTSLLSDGMNFQPAQVGATLDRQAAAQKEADAKLAASTNATKQWLAQKYPDLAQAVDAGLPVSEAWQQAFTRMQPGYGQTGNPVSYGTTPVWGYDPESKQYVYGVTGNDGSFKRVDTGGMQPLGPFDLNAQKAAGTVAGNTTTEAAVALPSTIAQAEQSLANLTGLLPQFDPAGNPMVGTNKGFDEQFGSIGPIPQQWLGALDGTEKAGFQSRIEQVQGQSFLTAIDQLRGMGALSNAEGQTATRAITRISQKLPRDEFIKAVKELQDIVARGVERAKVMAARSPAANMLGTAPASGNVTSTGVPWSLE